MPVVFNEHDNASAVGSKGNVNTRMHALNEATESPGGVDSTYVHTYVQIAKKGIKQTKQIHRTVKYF